MKRCHVMAAALSVLALAAAAACSGSDAPASSADSSPADAAPAQVDPADAIIVAPPTKDREDLAPDFVGVTRWLNSPPLTMQELRGKVVLVDFWTYTCVNCLRTMPYLRDWNEKYASRGLVMVGVHSPEFQFERDEGNVREAMVRERVTWPVAMDNDFATWRAYQNRYWPHKFLIDKDGEVRYDHIGEGAYQETELRIRAYLEEAGYDVSDIPVGGVTGVDEEQPGRRRITREIYAGRGWSRGEYLGNQEQVASGQLVSFTDPGDYVGGRFYLQGVWSFDQESVTHGRATEGFEDYVAIAYNAASVNVVVRPHGTAPFRVLVTLDGAPVPADDRGDDIAVDSQGNTFLQIDGPRMYNVVRSLGTKSGDLKLSANSADFSLYTYTFRG